MDQLPSEIIALIFHYLPLQDHATFSLLSIRISNIVRSEKKWYWKNFTHKVLHLNNLRGSDDYFPLRRVLPPPFNDLVIRFTLEVNEYLGNFYGPFLLRGRIVTVKGEMGSKGLQGTYIRVKSRTSRDHILNYGMVSNGRVKGLWYSYRCLRLTLDELLILTDSIFAGVKINHPTIILLNSSEY